MTEGSRLVVLEMTRIEATHLAGLVGQFVELLEDDVEGARTDDPAVARLVPPAYADDEEAAREFRSLTEDDLLSRRAADAHAVLSSLGPEIIDEDADLSLATVTDVITIPLDPNGVRSWLRTLAAVRLVLASRLGIIDDDDHSEDDPRFGIYDWLGFRLDGLVRAATED
ncbi:hypothetical protein CVS47_01608 [Microbacterium lemovicicum]|uniref:Uncharacterized protein n=1 Tax=Microbacterium lemovicicum TaxID=1072463 RepID=A0A3S9WAT9_9MICO|nr:DUF2017 family protein [Microbacterium lemovicicum]AZS36983.1 hypothetical protein CVS47_01608 [Microbacterium lemovicicum]